MSSRKNLEEKYKDYQRENTFLGWIKHIYLVFLSLLTEKKYYR